MELLYNGLQEPLPEHDGSMRTVVIGKALDILAHLHAAFVTRVEGEGGHPSQVRSGPEDPSLEDAKRRRVLHALLDLISLEGIYPTLSPGAGIPLRERVISVLPAGVIAKPTAAAADSNPQNEQLLDHILTSIYAILFDERPSIQLVICGRILSDIISGTASLAFNSISLSGNKRSCYHEAFKRVLKEYVSFLFIPLYPCIW